MDAILILGAAIWADGPSPTLRRRTAHAAQVFHERDARQVIPCGGMGNHPPTEAEAMRYLLTQAGVPEKIITLEDQSKTTLENIRFAKRLLTGPKVTIVTDRYHGARALMVARHFGLDATLSCPKGHRPTLKQRYREALARPTYALKLRRIPPDD